MDPNYHGDPIVREATIARYLSRSLDPGAAEAFESHYLTCQDCFEEIRATEILISTLGHSVLERTLADGIAVIRFNGSTELTASADLTALARIVQVQGDTKVLIDLSRVSRIDSAGLGMLMTCYTHAVRNAGVLKLLNPSSQVKHVLSMTRIDSVVPTFDDESAALRSFE